MYNFDEDVIKWNEKMGLLKKKFNPELEVSFLLSEILELMDYEKIFQIFKEYLEEKVKEGSSNSNEACTQLNDLLKCQNHDDFALFLTKHFLKKFEDYEFVDAVTDIEVFSVGARAKLGMTAEHIQECRKVVMESNYLKIPGDVNESGKQKKPENFASPDMKIKETLRSINAVN